MNTIPCNGIDGTHLFGFMAALGSLALLSEHAHEAALPTPSLYFGRDGIAILQSPTLTPIQCVDAIYNRLQANSPFYQTHLSQIDAPSSFTPALFAQLTANITRNESDILSGLACCVGEDTFESTLCASNGASHQYLVQSIRDILCLVDKSHLHDALFAQWTKTYEVPIPHRKQYKLGTRKPTLRLDPTDERLYAVRLTNPTTTEDYTTELGAQALAIPAFSLMPIIPRKRPITVASTREGNKVWFTWPLWDRPATLPTIRTLIAGGIERSDELRRRGVFAGYRAARIAGEKGKLSFMPSEGVW